MPGSNIYLLFITSYEMKVDFSSFFPQLFFTGFVFMTFAYYRYVITKADTLKLHRLYFGRYSLLGLVTTLISLAIQLFFTVFANSSLVESPLTINFFYNILTGLVVIFMVSTLVVWKRLILISEIKKPYSTYGASSKWLLQL